MLTARVEWESLARMKSERFIRFAAGMFIIALAMYWLLYTTDRRLRVGKGPWAVQFTTNHAGEPMLIIHQPTLDITNRTIEFAGETVPPNFQPVTLRFDTPQAVPAPVPFGRWIYHDLMYLPGVVTFDLFPSTTNVASPRHEIELLPAGIYINRTPHDWQQAEPWRVDTQAKRDWPTRKR